jgi:hypothetical protein
MMRAIRVTCTVPAEVLRAADRVAARLDRSRSWVVTDALRRLVGQAEPGGSAGAGAPASPPRRLQRAYRAAERSRLDHDLALTPEQRVRIAEEIAGTAPAGRRRPQRDRVLQFDTYEGYLDWKRFAGLEP